MTRAFFGLLAGGLLACGKTPLQTSQLVALVPKQPTALTLGGLGSVEATLTELNDSRCPSDAVCIWAGTIGATLTFTEGSTTQTVRLGYQKNFASDSISITLHQQRYWVQLLDATPYPSTKNGSLLRTATLRLRPA